jgi:hypothetical protein
MPRTTDAAVRKLIELDASFDTEPFIESANALVTEVCETAEDDDGNAVYDAARLELIERWLAAHYCAQRDPRATQESIGRGAISATYQSKVDLGFDNTHYGQMAMRLDTEGGLAKLNEQTKKGGKVRISITSLSSDVDLTS